MNGMDTRDLLENLPVFGFLPPDMKKLIFDNFVPAAYSFGTPIIQEGEEPDGFYVLVSGKARVIKKAENGEEIALNSLGSGESFGEMALLDSTFSKATVRASSDVQVLRLDRSVFSEFVKSHPDIREYFELQRTYRSLQNFFRLYTPFARLPVRALRVLLNELESVTVQQSELVIRQGDHPGPMYIVEEGRLRVFTEEDGRRNYVAYLRKGDFFGEMSLLKGIRRTATVEAVSPCKLFLLTEKTFAKLIRDFPDFQAQLEERIAQYDYKQVANVPLDFAEEMLPADIHSHEKVGPSQVDQIQEALKGQEPSAGPFASEDGRFVKKEKRIRRLQHVLQIDEMDCGAACLAMICRHFGRAVSLARIRQLLHVTSEGTSLRALCLAATELGLAARSVKASKRNITQMPLPAIVHWEGNHWVVLYDVDENYCRFGDPAVANRRLPRKEFEQKWTGYAALFDYTVEFEKAPEGKASLSWLWPIFKPFNTILIRALILALIVSALQMVLPVFTQVIVDRVLVENDFRLLHLLILSMIAVLIFMVLAMVVQRYLLSFSAVRIDSAALDFLTRKLLRLPMSYFHSRRTGDIQRRLEGMRWIREFLSQNGITGLTASVQLLSALVLMFLYSPLLSVVFLATAPFYGAMMFLSRKWLRPLFDETEDAMGRYSSFQIDAIQGMETVKAMGAENTFREKMLSQFHRVARRMFRADFTIMCYEGGIQAVTFLSIALFLWVGAQQVMAGKLTIGGLVAFNSLVALANGPIGVLLTLWDNLQMADILLNRLDDVLQQEPEQGVDHSVLIPVKSLEGRVRFHNLGFRYGGPDSSNILEGITFEVPPGKTVAIVGRSGSGKTTLVKCLAGLLEPTEGTIFYDGVDMKTLNHRDLRRKIGFVLQESYLFDDTIARNIAFGDTEPDMDRVLWAARAAYAHEFIERLPLGYDTRVGESGISLSGGQSQRVAIGRALYGRPPVLIFDEATSSLDTESERAVKGSIDQLLQGRTSFVIAHRLSTIRDADFIVVLEKGKIAETGNHDELMKQQGLYFYLCSQQLGL